MLIMLIGVFVGSRLCTCTSWGKLKVHCQPVEWPSFFLVYLLALTALSLQLQSSSSTQRRLQLQDRLGASLLHLGNPIATLSVCCVCVCNL